MIDPAPAPATSTKRKLPRPPVKQFVPNSELHVVMVSQLPEVYQIFWMPKGDMVLWHLRRFTDIHEPTQYLVRRGERMKVMRLVTSEGDTYDTAEL